MATETRMSAAELRDLFDRVKSIEPLETVNGVKVVTFEEQRDAAVQDKMDNVELLDTIQFNPDGSVARTPTKYAAVSPERYFINRCKKVKDALYVVTDYRAIMDIPSGTIYQKQIPAFVIKRNEEGKLTRERVVNITDDEFIADFTIVLDREAMEVIKPLCVTDVGVTKSALPI